MKKEADKKKKEDLKRLNLAQCSNVDYYAHYQPECNKLITSHYDSLSKLQKQKEKTIIKASAREKTKAHLTETSALLSSEPTATQTSTSKKFISSASKYIEKDLVLECLSVVINSRYKDFKSMRKDNMVLGIHRLYSKVKKDNLKQITLDEYLKLIYWYVHIIEKKTGNTFFDLTPLASPEYLKKYNLVQTAQIKNIMMNSGNTPANSNNQSASCGTTHKDNLLDNIKIKLNPQLTAYLNTVIIHSGL